MNIKEIEELLAKVTEGEWRVIFKHHRAYEIECDGMTLFLVPARYEDADKIQDESNALFTVYAPATIRFLLGEVRRKDEALKYLSRTICDGAHELPEELSVESFKIARKALAPASRGE